MAETPSIDLKTTLAWNRRAGPRDIPAMRVSEWRDVEGQPKKLVVSCAGDIEGLLLSHLSYRLAGIKIKRIMWFSFASNLKNSYRGKRNNAWVYHQPNLQ